MDDNRTAGQMPAPYCVNVSERESVASADCEMAFDHRKTAVAAAGFCSFLNLYSPQTLLPELAREFGVRAANISAVMTASTLAIALTAPFTGQSRM